MPVLLGRAGDADDLGEVRLGLQVREEGVQAGEEHEGILVRLAGRAGRDDVGGVVDAESVEARVLRVIEREAEHDPSRNGVHEGRGDALRADVDAEA